jgi:hypothetical protein
MMLSGSDRDVFVAALDREPRPAPRLVEKLRRQRHLFA